MKKWEVQREANLLAFLEEEEYAKRKEFFFEFVKEFEERKIKWCLFCSSSLYFWGLTDHFNDFDVLIDLKCIPDAIDAMRAIGAKMERREVHGIELDVKRDIDEKEIEKIDQFFKEHAKKDGFASNQYINFSFREEANMDMISGFGLSAMDLKYVHTYNPGNVVNMEIEDKLVPILIPEVQYILYCLMEIFEPTRRFKREALQEYIKIYHKNGKSVAKAALKQKIPASVRALIKRNL